jgi:hypothetical protein
MLGAQRLLGDGEVALVERLGLREAALGEVVEAPNWAVLRHNRLFR